MSKHKPKKTQQQSNRHKEQLALDTNCHYLDVRRQSRVDTDSIIKEKGKIHLTVIDLVDHAHEICDKSITKVNEISPPEKLLACQEGCSHCCMFPVTTIAPEVFRIIEYLLDSLSLEHFQEVKERAIQLHDSIKDKSLNQKIGVPCALLENNKCIAYKVRPLTCRGHNSTDVKKCEEAITNKKTPIPIYTHQRDLSITVLEQVREALRLNNMNNQELELAAALRIAMEMPESIGIWLNGNETFADAIRKPCY